MHQPWHNVCIAGEVNLLTESLEASFPNYRWIVRSEAIHLQTHNQNRMVNCAASK